MPIFHQEKSKIKMVGLTGPKEKNIVWYSILTHNKKPVNVIIAGMLRRFQASTDFKRCKVIHFYDTSTNQLIHEIK